MTVSTFLVTFPNGHILYLGSWHHETHPTIVYEDEIESTRPGAWTQTSQQRWEMAAGTAAERAVLHAAAEILTENSPLPAKHTSV